MPIESINPASGQVIRKFDEMSPEVAASVVAAAHDTWLTWRDVSFADRAPLMKKAASILRGQKDELAALMASEMGKPLKQGVAEAEKCAWVCDYYADNAESQLSAQIIKTDAEKSYVAFQPIGVVLAVMPWNFPLWQVYRFAAPALMAGNVGVLKHASNVTGCALVMEEMFRQAGFPKNAFRTLVIGSKQVEAVIRNPLVKAVTLTGSTPAGKAVASQAGSVLKKTVLELGGSDAYVVLEDADMESAVSTCVDSRLINSGQSCIAAKRFIVVESVLKDFTDRFVARMKSKKVGDPFVDGTD
ncbi:MAG: aldehyde dehydrogenase family protein, partial [Gemmatimonadota bacterium]|nr:aldehyde dehydrogenase family protein [Gemmatimonadota bacterium]